ncbi:hypothetical protein C8F01DRAFT_651541 [Mycena amicta]|nr:hypothetical protein C8F01DRAFT_651541 [Mycena amicta]
MFAKLALPLIAVSAFATGVFSSPVAIPRSIDRRNHGHISFNNYQNIGFTSNFDNFYGVNDFNGHSRHQTVIEQSPELVCHSQQVTIIQQRLAVLSEMARRVVTELSCEVETQTIVFEQYYQSLGHFHDDLRRHSGYQVGYDQGITSHFEHFYNPDGSLCTDDWGFSGSDIGSQTVVVSQNNWVEPGSRRSVEDAYFASKNAYLINQFS